MSVMEWPHCFLTLDDWVGLPEIREFHVEVVEGVLLLMPRPLSFHQRATNRLTYWLEEQLPGELSAVSKVEVVVAEVPLTVRVPDVVVVPTSVVETNPARLRAGDVRLAIEVLSEGSRRTDRVTKLSEYAEAGIEHYWIVDLDPPVSMITCRLVEDNYEDFSEHSGHAKLEFAGAPITIDLNALTTPRAQRL